MHGGIHRMFAFSSGLCSWINKDSRICIRRPLLSLPFFGFFSQKMSGNLGIGKGCTDKHLVGQDFCFYYMFKTHFSGHNKIWGALPPNKILKSRHSFLHCVNALATQPHRQRLSMWQEHLAEKTNKSPHSNHFPLHRTAITSPLALSTTSPLALSPHSNHFPPDSLPPSPHSNHFPPGSSEMWPFWASLNRLRNAMGLCKDSLAKWGYKNDVDSRCFCGKNKQWPSLFSVTCCQHNSVPKCKIMHRTLVRTRLSLKWHGKKKNQIYFSDCI